MTAPDSDPSSINTGGGASIGGSIQAGDFAGRDNIVHGDEVRGHKITTRSPQEELRDYLAAAVPSYASAQMQRVLNAQLQQSITEPYKFLDSFDLEDANFFFGRSAAVQALYRTVIGNRLTVLHAKSGAGKTSLLNAGLAPKLITTGRLPIYARAFQDPVQAVKRAVAPGSAGPWPDLLHKLSLSEFLGLVSQHLPPRVQEIVLILDQFEEFFIFWPLREQRQPFIDNFAQCYRDSELPVRFILSLRKDYYSDLAEFESYIPKIFRSQLRLDPMERTQAAEAITSPVTKLGSPVTYAPDLLNAILDDLGGSGMELPHMQIICTRLFDDALAAGAKTIDLSTYETLGQAPGILGNYLNSMLAYFPGRGETIAKMVLKELVSSEATKRTLSSVTLASRIEASPMELIDSLTRLVNARLLRRDEVEGEIVYEMAHEYLVAEIMQWVDRSDLALKQVEELLSREVTNWRIHRTLIPRDRLELIYAQRDRLGLIDDATGECLLRSALQSGCSVEEWTRFVSDNTILPLLALLHDTSLDIVNPEARRHIVTRLGFASEARVMESLIAALKDDDSRVRSATAEALAKVGDAAVEPLITSLKDTDGLARCTAAEALGKLGNARTVDPLIAALKDEDWRVRSATATALGRLGSHRAVDPLMIAFKDAAVEVRRAAAEALGKLGAPAVDPLIAALKDADVEVRQAAVELLSKLGDVRAVGQLIVALKDADVEVRRVAVEALGEFGDARGVEQLIITLKDANWGVRWAAAEALGKLGDAAVEPLITSLNDNEVRWAAAEALGKLGDARAVGPLISTLNHEESRVRRVAANALGELGDARAVESLITLLKDADGEVRWAAVEALGKLGGAAVEPVIASLNDKDAEVRRASVEVLSRLGDARAVEPLIAVLKDSHRMVSLAAAEALGKSGDAAVQPLITSLRDADRRVRRAAVEVLSKLGDAAVEPLITTLNDTNWEVRRVAVDMLGKLGDARAVEPLIVALQDKWIHKAATMALGKLGNAAVEPLTACLTDKELRKAATLALRAIGTPEALSALELDPANFGDLRDLPGQNRT